MTSIDWQRVRPLLERALDLPAAARPAFLERACAGDGALRALVDRLLREEFGPDAFLQPPAESTYGVGTAPTR